jgi:hypothetical protein
VIGASASVDAGGGTGGGGGRFLLGNNTTASFGGTVNVASTLTGPGPQHANPFEASVNTPLIPDLVGGAEAYGLTTLTSAAFPSVVAGAPTGVSAALFLEHLGPGTYNNDFNGYDVLFIINLTSQTLHQPTFTVGSTSPLLQGGWQHDPLFGGSGGPQAIDLGPNQVYATLVPVGTTTARFSFVQNGVLTQEATTTLSPGVPFYNISGPVASANGPYAINAGSGVTLNGTASDPNGYSLSVSWTINGHVNAASGLQPTLSWAQLQALGVTAGGATPTLYAISLQADDGHGHVTSASGTLVVSAVVGPTVSGVIDVTSQLQITLGKVRSRGGHLRQVIALKNSGPVAIGGPIRLVFAKLPRRVRLMRRSGLTHVVAPLQSPYMNVPLNGSNQIAPGQTVTVSLDFLGRAPHFAYELQVLAGDGPV